MVNFKEFQLTESVKLLVSMEQERTYMAIQDKENTADFFSISPEKQEEFLTKLLALIGSYNDETNNQIMNGITKITKVGGSNTIGTTETTGSDHQVVLIAMPEVDAINLSGLAGSPSICYQHQKEPIMLELIQTVDTDTFLLTEEDVLTQNTALVFDTLDGSITTNVSLTDGDCTIDLMDIKAYNRIAFKKQFEALCDRFNYKLTK
jgi:hypothetical protein